MTWQGNPDPVEIALERGLERAGIEYRRADNNPKHLDFYLPEFDLYVEVKRFHTDRVHDQMSRTPDIIVIQGLKAAIAFVKMIGGYQAKKNRRYVPLYREITEWNECRSPS